MKINNRKDIYKNIFNQDFLGNETQLNDEIAFQFTIIGQEIKVIDNSNGTEVIVEVLDESVYTPEGEIACLIRDLDLFTDFRNKNICQECMGEGYVDVLTCFKPASECCGGCYKPEKCDCELPYPYFD